ncbi:MAG: MFS transporter [Fimbriimonas sp.]
MGNAADPRRLALYLFLVTSSFGFLQPFLPLYMEAAGLTRMQIGLVTGLGTGLAFVVQPFLGRLSDRLDARRPFICACALGAGLAYLAFPFAHGLPVFFALVAFGANGTMYLQTAGGVLIGRMAQSTGGGALYANLRVWGSVGYIVTSLVSGLMMSGRSTDRGGLDLIFFTGPFVFFAIAALAWALPDRKSEVVHGEPVGKAPLPESLRRFLIAYFFYVIALYGASGFLSLYMKSLGGAGLWITGTFAAGVVIEVLVMRWSGRFSDRYGRRPALAFSFVLLPIRLMLYVPATGPLWILMVQTLHGINFGIVGAVAVVFVNDLATERTRGHAQSRLTAVSGLAMAFGPVIFGTVAQASGLSMMFAVASGIAAVGAAVFLFGVEDSHPFSDSIADQAPERMRRALGWLDAPPKRKRP